MDDSLPPDEMDTPVVQMPERGLSIVRVDGDALEAKRVDDDSSGELDFEILQIAPRANMEMGPGSKGRMVPYYSYGWAAIMSPQTSLVGGDGKKMAIAVPLPASGLMKMTELKRLANRMWREARQSQMDD